MKGRLYLVDDKPEIELEDGTIIEHKNIGYISHTYGNYPMDSFYDLITSADIHFIIKNNIVVEVEMIDEFSNPEEYNGVHLFEGIAKPKKYKNKVIIHLK